MSNPVFKNADGSNFPQGGTEIGWTAQGVQLNPQNKPSSVFPLSAVFTPATRPSWTVQSTVDGSDQSTVSHAGV